MTEQTVFSKPQENKKTKSSKGTRKKENKGQMKYDFWRVVFRSSWDRWGMDEGGKGEEKRLEERRKKKSGRCFEEKKILGSASLAFLSGYGCTPERSGKWKEPERQAKEGK